MVLTYFRHKVITNQYAVMGTRWTNINGILWVPLRRQ
jgi:hypothetical protein